MRGPKSIEPFFYPKSVAVIGASAKAGKIGYTVFSNLKKAVKKIFPVNPKHRNVQGKKCYKNVLEIPSSIDLAVISLPAQKVPEALAQCARKKVKAAVIISAGFSEVGEKRSTQRLLNIIKRNSGTRVMGPNCVGILNNHSGIDTTFFDRARMKAPKKGSLSFISQSGALGSMILDWTSTQEFGISKFASYGNAMDVDEADLLEYLGQDAKTKVITAYLEGAKHGRKFFEIAKKISRKKPIVVLKGGKNEQTSKAAGSHTGSLAGSAAVYDAVFRQAGIIQADDMIDLFATAKLLEEEPLTKGRRVQIITNGGGFGIVAADQMLAKGLKLAKISGRTRRRLAKALPDAILSNPMDLLADADAKSYGKAISGCIADKNVDMVMVLILFSIPTLNPENLALLRKPSRKIKKPLVVVATGGPYTKKFLTRIEKAGFTTFNYPSIAAKALAETAFYAEFLRKG